MKTQKKNKWLIFSILMLSLPLVQSFAPPYSISSETAFSNIADDPCQSINTAFQGGEELIYKVYYNWGFVWLSAGEVTFRVIDDDDQFHYQVVGETFDSYNWFFEVNDYFDTWVQKTDLLPIFSKKTIHEGKYRLYDELTFDQSRHKVHNIRGKAKDDLREDKNYNISSCMHDMVSILYYARNLDFDNIEKGERFPINIFADKKTWPLSVKFEGREKNKKVKGKGKFNTLKFSPQVIEGDVFPEDANVHVWVTDDQNRIPLIIESPLSVGSAKAVLHKHSGLRHSMSAKVAN